jgi:hypothetical protein
MKVEIYQLPTLPTSLRTSSPTSNGPLAPSGSLSSTWQGLYLRMDTKITFVRMRVDYLLKTQTPF